MAVANVAATGAAPLLWGADFPHEEGTFPRSREVVARLAAGLSTDDAAAIFGHTAAGLFGFGADVLAATP